MTFYSVCYVTFLIILVFVPTAAVHAQENGFDTDKDVETEDGETDLYAYEDADFEAYEDPDFDIYDDADLYAYEDYDFESYEEPDFDIYDDTDLVVFEEPDFDIYDDTKPKDVKTSNRPFIVFNEGAAASWLTRIVKQTDRSNFVFSDFLVGLYLRMDMENIKIVTPLLRLAVYYPLNSTFNDFPQLPKIPLHYSADLNTGVKFDIFDFKYFRLDLGVAIHLFFLNAERWNYLDLGAAAFLGMELPLTRRWTFLCGGFASLDNGNLGGNSLMEPFDIVYQYQIEIGVRYSKKLANRTFLFAKKPQTEEIGESFLLR